MEAILTKTYTQAELENVYNSDTLGIHDELISDFKTNNPDALMKIVIGEQSDNGDDTFTYVLTITYEI